jgi:exodeoxyribonuclease V gamma subunit
VLGLVQHEPVRRRFGWSVEHVEQFADWCISLGTRWGLSPDHRLEWGLPQHVATGTWSAMVDRLMAGAAMPAPSPRLGLGDTPPHDDMGADEVQLAGAVADLLCRLTDLHSQVLVPQTIEQWASLLHGAIDDFCAFDPAEPWRRQRVHRQVEQLLQSARRSPHSPDTCDIPLSLAELQSALNHSLADSPGRLSLRSGAVTVSSFLPQHGVPARVVCLLGLDDSALRSGVFDGDDVLGLHPCLGERHPRFESRQLLLDAVLSASERLIITCNGSDLTTNKEIPLVVPLAELLDVVARLVPLDKHRHPVVLRHPRHGFNERTLRPGELVPGSGQPFTFDPAMLHAAMARRSVGSGTNGSVSPWVLPPAIVESVDLQQLIDVVANPSKVYLRDRLDVRLPGDAQDVDDGLALSVDALTRSNIGRSLLDSLVAGQPVEQWMQAARLDGALPPGELNRAALDGIAVEVDDLLRLAAEMQAPLGGGARVDIESTLQFGDQRGQHTLPLSGVVDGVLWHSGLEGTVGRVRYNRPRPSHRFGLALQLAALQVSHPNVEWTGVLVTRGDSTPSGCTLRLRSDTHSQRDAVEAATLLLTTATSLLLWAMRDAVPFFDHVSAKLAFDDINGADTVLSHDTRDRHVSTLWPELSLEQLRWDPVADDDPGLLSGFDSPQGGGSRAVLVARWLWHTYHSVIREEDAQGNEIVPAVPSPEVGE